jgi:zinc protease
MSRAFSKTVLLLLALTGLPLSAQVEQASDLRYPPLAKLDVPTPRREVLPNGVVVLLLEDHELPLVDLYAVVRGGARLDPAGKSGLAQLSGSLLRSGGTASLAGDALDDWLDDHAASIEVATSDGDTRLFANGLVRDEADLVRLLADVLRRPAFDARRLEIERNRAIADVARQNENVLGVVGRETVHLAYGPDSAYGRTPTLASLGGVRREDVVDWHRRNVQPDRLILALVGDFRSDEVLRHVRDAFGDWPRGGSPLPPPGAWREAPAPGIYYVRKDDLTQSGVGLSQLGVRKDDPDFYALEVLNELFGTGQSSRLFANVRSRKGLAYAVSGFVGSAWDHPGVTRLYLSTKVQTTGAAIDALLEETKRLSAEPPTAQEVELAKKSLLESFVFRVDSPRKVLLQQLDLESYGYPADWYSHYRAGIEAVTLAQVRAATSHIRPQDLAILVVGPEQGRDKALESYGTVHVIDLETPGTPKGK